MESRLTFRNKVTEEAWQYKIRKQKEADWLSSGKYQFWNDIDLSLKKAVVREVERKTAEKIILEYEWLGDMAITNKYYGIFFGSYCGGVICINTNGVCPGNGKQFGIKDSEYSYFARGACPFWTPKGTASKLLTYAAKFEAKRGAKVCIGFADTDAGEYGTVYQASGWLCLGRQLSNSYQYIKNNKILDSRSISQSARRHNMKPSEYETHLKKSGWLCQQTNYKYRYIKIIANEPYKSSIFAKIQHLISEYPKRLNAALAHKGEQDTIQYSGAFDSTMPLYITAH
jgi:hypothetical protein